MQEFFDFECNFIKNCGNFALKTFCRSLLNGCCEQFAAIKERLTLSGLSRCAKIYNGDALSSQLVLLFYGSDLKG
jgi:hypothetical protein